MSDVVQQQTRPASNGHAASLHHDDEIVAAIRVQADALEARRQELQSQLDEITPALRRYQRAIASILGEPLTPQGVRKTDPETGEPVRNKPGPKPGSKQHGTKTGAGISEEALRNVEKAFRQVAADHDDVRQVDVRSLLDIKSGTAALAFRELRARGVIRLARVSGNNKYFRLTRGALNGEDPETLLDDAQNELANVADQ